MALFSMTASIPRVLFLVSLALAMAAGPWPVAARGGRLIHLHFYMHDITGGPDQTAVQVVKGPGAVHPLMPGSHFGDTTVIDDALTEGPSAASRLIGRAQGTYMLASLKEPVLMVTMTVALTGGAYNGSTIAVVGRDDVSAGVRELSVIGGTGAFRRATGHVLWRTSRIESRDHMVLELDVYATVPGGSLAPPPRVDGMHQAA
ncbi:dirigent protein 1-like [Phragmites australis]|uniref:dirigent protein 1-like n=1 Tax=Phragmites australis TaxID=29695 RepID=UPI002D78F7CD|nr:dirigent protein 1-like [Phragmites australis]